MIKRINTYVFKLVEDGLETIGRLTRRTYNEINIIVYYFLIPFSWLLLIDIIFDVHYLKIAFVVFCLGFYAGCRNFRTYSDWLFNKSVDFLNYFNRFGSNYVASSVWICVSVPIAVYALLFYLAFKG